MRIPLQMIGLLAGSLYVLVAVLLAFRSHLFDDVEYVWYIWVGYFLFGAGIIFAVLNIYVVGVIHAAYVTLAGYLFLIAALAVTAYYAWVIYPDELLPDGGVEVSENS